MAYAARHGRISSNRLFEPLEKHTKSNQVIPMQRPSLFPFDLAEVRVEVSQWLTAGAPQLGPGMLSKKMNESLVQRPTLWFAFLLILLLPSFALQTCKSLLELLLMFFGGWVGSKSQHSLDCLLWVEAVRKEIIQVLRIVRSLLIQQPSNAKRNILVLKPKQVRVFVSEGCLTMEKLFGK